MTDRKLLALALSTTLCLAVTTGLTTYGLFTDSESLTVEFSGNVAGNAPDEPAPTPTGAPDDADTGSGRPSEAGNAPAGSSERAGNVAGKATDGAANAPAGAGNAPSSAGGAVIGGSAGLELRVAPRTS